MPKAEASRPFHVIERRTEHPDGPRYHGAVRVYTGYQDALAVYLNTGPKDGELVEFWYSSPEQVTLLAWKALA